MFKNVIAPVQAWLLSQGRCVGCGTQLPDGKKLLVLSVEEFLLKMQPQVSLDEPGLKRCETLD